jgi:hypothetical protein
MRIISEGPITNTYLRNTLEQSAEIIMRADGDRDYMNGSNLTVQQTTAIAAFLRLAAERIKS